MKPIIIIGAGLAGWALVREIRKIDTTTALMLISEDSADYYSKPDLSAALGRQQSPQGIIIHPAKKMATDYSVTILSHTQLQEIHPNEHCITTDKGCFEYSALVLALGAQARQSKATSEYVYSVNHLNDYQRFIDAIDNHPEKPLCILGSGLIGCEFANDLLNKGIKAQVYSIDAYPLSRWVPESIGRALQAAFEAKGVQWHLNLDPDHSTLNLPKDALILSALGLEAQILIAKRAGIETRTAIVCDAFGQSSAPKIYAIGDCAEINGYWLPYIMPITHAARSLAKTLTGTQTKITYPCMPIVLKTPLFPMCIIPPRQGISVEWVIENIDGDLQATGFADGKAEAYVLCGNLGRTAFVKARGLSPWLSE